jgi:hypothetical protein
MLHRLFLAVGLVAAAASLGACRTTGVVKQVLGTSLGGTYDYSSLWLPLDVKTDHSIVVAVIDERPAVVKGDKSPAFVGTISGRYRNDVDVTTKSNEPLAGVIADATTAGLQRHGITATAVPTVKPGADPEALAAARTSGADRLLVVHIGAWETRAVVRVEAKWQFEADVFDRSGKLLGQRRTQGAETIGTAGFDEKTNELAVSALRQHLTYLLGDPEITRALGGP